MKQPQPRHLKVLGLAVSFFSAVWLVVSIVSFQHAQPGRRNLFTFQQPGKTTQAGASVALKDISNQTLGFQKIFAINMPVRSDRRDSMSLAADLTDLRVEFVDAVDHVDEMAKPPHDPDWNPNDGYWGSWRSHMNVLRTIVDEDITTALIFEDDADWDVRIKSQMESFAMASQALTNMESVPETYSHSAAPHAGVEDPGRDQTTEVEHNDDINVTATVDAFPMSPKSPYGDIASWDVLWLGHCGMRFPEPQDPVPQTRAILYNDSTVPEPQHIGIEFLGSAKVLKEQYPPHTRVVHHVSEAACSAAYAVSLPGARRLLYEMSTRMTEIFDIMMSEVCGGRKGRTRHKCLSVQPQLFNQHRPAGPRNGQSNNDAANSMGDRKTAFSRNIRWSTRVNFAKLVDGKTDYIDSFPDGAPATDVGF